MKARFASQNQTVIAFISSLSKLYVSSKVGYRHAWTDGSQYCVSPVFSFLTLPFYNRLELEGGKIVVGDFQDFQGRPEDLAALKFVKRSAVSHLTMVHCRGWVRNIIGK
jgi:hypothetical protein